MSNQHNPAGASSRWRRGPGRGKPSNSKDYVVLDPKKRLLYLSITAAGVIIAFISFYTPWVTVEGYGQSISLSLADAGRAGHGPYNLSIVATAVAMAGGIVFLFSKHLRRQYLLSAGTAVGIGAVVIIRNFVVNIDVGSLSKIPSVNAERGLGYWLYALSGILIAAGAILLSLLASKAPAVAAAPGPGGSPAPSYGPGRQPPAGQPPYAPGQSPYPGQPASPYGPGQQPPARRPGNSGAPPASQQGFQSPLQ